ncbi:hypothetical protein MFIFM68171_02861 [Madurella fahalii]|uniref:Uncharacterized protein n=1 Tax=Madurella fahalii TaxID=1157608 RepID=A0ABQ0G4F8_9PEZI
MAAQPESITLTCSGRSSGQTISEARSELRSALGLTDDAGSKPYLDYIESSWPGRGELIDFLQFYTRTIYYFGHTIGSPRTIQSYIDELVSTPAPPYFSDTVANSQLRILSVREVVLLILGNLLLQQSYFILGRNDQRRIVLAYCVSRACLSYSEDGALAESIPSLVSQSGLLPNQSENSGSDQSPSQASIPGDEIGAFHLHASVSLLESFSIDRKRLNAVRLVSLGGVKFTWTTNISRHLLLSKHEDAYFVELFSLPCALQDGSGELLARMGISANLMDEIESSYSTLFNPFTASSLHRILKKTLALRCWCWCLECSSFRLRHRLLANVKLPTRKNGGPRHSITIPKDPRVKSLMEKDPSEWDRTEFKDLFPRILALDSHLQKCKPWSIWVIFLDKRDTVQYWTFL